MAGVADPTVTTVQCRDGATVTYRTSGEGPPLVLVHGTASNHTTWRALLPHLEPHATLHAVDRRGRGASSDGSDYDVEHEFEDVAAVVDAVAAGSGRVVDVLGHSFGGFCALGAAALTPHLRRLVLYEPPVARGANTGGSPLLGRLEAKLEDGDRDGVLETFLREGVSLSDEAIDAFRSVPGWWESRMLAAHTIPRELRAEIGSMPVGVAGVSAPTLLLLGADSPDSMRADTEYLAATLPDARIVMLEGQAHLAHLFVPDVFASHVVAFLRDQH